MDQLTEKELSFLNDALSEEELLVKKYKMLAEQTEDAQIQLAFNKISNQHQGHFNTLYEQLK